MLKKILIKVSGEMLGGNLGQGFEHSALQSMAESLQKAYQTKAHIGVVIGAGNIIRGIAAQFLTRTKADAAGMLGTAINSIILQDILEKDFSIPSTVLGSFAIEGLFPQASPIMIAECFRQNKLIIFAGGTGAPYFSTDTAGVLKALEMGADLMIKATKVDGVYNKDPKKFPDAVKYDTISYMDTLKQQLEVMDLTATSLAMENKLPIRVVNLCGDNLVSIINGVPIGTLIS
ncbi:MAG: uridine monophosphate kinase [Brevinema sp.]